MQQSLWQGSTQHCCTARTTLRNTLNKHPPELDSKRQVLSLSRNRCPSNPLPQRLWAMLVSPLGWGKSKHKEEPEDTEAVCI